MSRAIVAVALALTLTPFVAACAGSDGAAPAGASGAGAANAAGASGVVVGDGKAFVPDGITYSLVEGGRDLTLISATMLDDPDGSYWVFSVRNDGNVPICSPQVNAAFASAGHESDFSGGQAVIAVQAAMYRYDAVDQPCLPPGDIGMGVGWVSWPESGPMKTIQIDYQPRGYVGSDLVKRPGLTVGALKIESSAAGNVVTGVVKNSDAIAAAAPVEITIFALDSAGRPIDFGYDSSDAALVAGGSWTFTTTIPSPINKYVAFAVYGRTPL